VGQNRPNVVRLVFDLKEEVAAGVHAAAGRQLQAPPDLRPVSRQGADPIAAMIEKGDWSDGKAASRQCRQRRQASGRRTPATRPKPQPQTARPEHEGKMAEVAAKPTNTTITASWYAC
jgi:N-acetylmuramoyl-L-alanine amidase